MPSEASGSLPSNWSAVPPGEDYIRVQLSAASDEYQGVYRQFASSIQNVEATVLRIERVQNPFMWEKYTRYVYLVNSITLDKRRQIEVYDTPRYLMSK